MTRRAILILVALTLAACTPAQMRLWDEIHGYAPGTTETVVASIRAQEAADAARRPATPAAIIRDVFGVEGDRAVRVATCESELNPRAVSPTGDFGILQINAKTWARPNHPDPVAQWIGRNWHNVYDVRTNAMMALKIRVAYGWQMWACRG